MAQEPRRSSYRISMFGLVLYTLLCGAVPLYHQFTRAELKPVLTINLDGLYLFLFLLGVGTIVAIAGLNARIASLEKKSNSPNAN